MQVTVEMVNVLYELGQQHFSCGNYVEASELLYRFRILVGPPLVRRPSRGLTIRLM